LRLIKGDARQATDSLEQAFSVCRTNDMPAYVPRISAALGLAYALSGDAVKAVPMLERAAADAAGRKQSASYPQVVLLAGEVYLLGDRPGEAAAAATRALDLFRQQRERGHEASALRLLADIACQGAPADLKSADALYRQALALAEELGMRPLEARCQLGLGSLNRQRGDPVKARACLATATAAFREMAMEFWLSRVRAEMTSLR
jgi:tetratricopeptide (TPR) repeat protein